MKTQWELLLGLFIINLAIGIVVGLSLPGTNYTQTGGSINADDYEAHFNSSQIAEDWGTVKPFAGIPIVGDIFNGFSYLWSNIQYLVDGLPMFLNWIKDTYIQDSGAQLAFDIIANALRAIYALLIAMFFIEFISGRIWTD